MNKYIKIAIEKKLEDNSIKIGDKFKVDGWNADWYIYNGHTIWNKVFGCFDKIVEMNETNQYTFLNNEIIKLDEYIKIDFETAFKKMRFNNEKVYIKRHNGKMVEVWLCSHTETFKSFGVKDYTIEYEYVSSNPDIKGLTIKRLVDFEFYVKG